MSAAALNLPTARTAYRKGITVYVHEVIPGDVVRDDGAWRTVVRVVPAESDERSSREVFEPVEGSRPDVSVPNRIQVYVLRGCAP
jgi:hypothetical protein